MKRYPFNMSKHQHDISFRCTRVMNEYDAKCYEGSLTPEECDKYDALIEGLDRLLDYGVGIVWLTGKEFSLARDTVIWANLTRGE